MQTSAPLSGSTAGRSQRMHFTPLASGRRLPALGVQVLVGALLEHPAGLSPSDVCSKADVPTKPKKKKPKKPPRICQHARDQVVLCRRRFSSCIALLCSGGCCPGIPLEEPQIAGRHGGVCRREQRAVSIKGKSSPLVCAPADSQRVLLCLSAVTSAFLSPTYPGARSQPPRRAGAPPQRSQGRLERREQQHFQDEQECAPRRAVLASSLILYS